MALINSFTNQNRLPLD